MKKAVKGAILGAVGVGAVANAIKAAKFVPEKVDYGTPSEEKVDAQRAMDNLSKAISIPTVSYPEKEKVDFSKF